MRALANEVAKNLVLAGIGSLTIVDDGIVTEDDLGAQFFITDADVGKNRAEAALPQIQKLNPRVRVTAVTEPVLSLLPEFYSPFTLVIACDLPIQILSMVNAATRLSNKPCYLAGSHGFYGFIFADLISHEYIIEREMSNRTTKLGPESDTRSIISSSKKKESNRTIELVGKREIYSPLLLANTSPLPKTTLQNRRRLRNVSPLLSCLRALWDFEKTFSRAPLSSNTSESDLKHFASMASNCHRDLQLPAETLTGDFLKAFLQNLGSELAPVTAFLGGQLAQDVINVLGGREQPIQNFLLFDADESQGTVYPLHPIFQDGLDGELGVVSAGTAGIQTTDNNTVAAVPDGNATTANARPGAEQEIVVL
jgi:ubiquitin-like 1-activating enzyme E1 A